MRDLVREGLPLPDLEELLQALEVPPPPPPPPASDVEAVTERVPVEHAERDTGEVVGDTLGEGDTLGVGRAEDDREGVAVVEADEVVVEEGVVDFVAVPVPLLCT